MNETLTLKETTNVKEDSPEDIEKARRHGQILLDLIENADIRSVEDADWDDFQVEDEGTSKDLKGTVTLVPAEMLEEIESMNAA